MKKSSVFTKYHHIKSVCFVHSKNRPKTRKPFVHTLSYISKRTVKKIIFYIHSQTCPLAWWSLREMVGSRHTGITSLPQWFTADCLWVVLHPWVRNVLFSMVKTANILPLCHSDGRCQLFCWLCACSLCYKELFTSSSSLIIIIFVFVYAYIITSNRPKPNSFTLYMQIYVSQITACLWM